MNKAVVNAAHIVWDYMQVNQLNPTTVDIMIVLGSRDERVATVAAKLLETLVVANVFVTGGVAHQTDLLAPSWGGDSEATHFAKVMYRHGYKGKLHLEDKATNTGENAALVSDLLHLLAIPIPLSLLLVTKPYMERRAARTFEKQWSVGNPRIYVTSQKGSLENYVCEEQPLDDVINLVVGDLQRIIDYPARGFMTPSLVPKEILAAHKILIEAGYTKHL